MAITTKRGDYGETDLMFGRRVPKDHPRVVAVGAIDELNANLGIVRVSSQDVSEIIEKIEHIQNDLIILMGEISTLPEDLDLYQKKGFERFEEKRTEILERWIKEIEDKKSDYQGWALPGASGSIISVHLDSSRVVCRRAEREYIKLGENLNESIIMFLNRLSDLLWLMAREEDKKADLKEEYHKIFCVGYN